MHRGGCLCGAVAFEIEGPLAPIQVCHCSQCRRAQGGPFATNIPVAESALRWLRGTEALKRHESSPGKFRVFCRECGSPIFSQRTSLPGVLRLRAGLLDEPVASAVELHMHVASKASWWTIEDKRPQYAAGYPPVRKD